MVDDVARRAVERTFKTVWRLLLRLTSDEALLKRASAIYARWRNTGQLSARIIEPGLAELRLTGWPGVSDRQLRIIGISVQTAVVLAGGHDVRFDFEATRDGALYALRWRDRALPGTASG